MDNDRWEKKSEFFVWFCWWYVKFIKWSEFVRALLPVTSTWALVVRICLAITDNRSELSCFQLFSLPSRLTISDWWYLSFTLERATPHTHSLSFLIARKRSLFIWAKVMHMHWKCDKMCGAFGMLFLCHRLYTQNPVFRSEKTSLNTKQNR